MTMTTDFRVAEVGLTYKNRVPKKDRKQIFDSYTAYKVLKENFSDGYKDDLRVSSTTDLYRTALELFNNYNIAKQIHLMQQLGNTSMTEHQFCQILCKMRLYQCLPTGVQKHLPRMLLTDTQINSVAKAYINDSNFGGESGELNMWRFYNLLTGANKSSYIDSFLDRSLNASEIAMGINSALHGDEQYKWFIE